MASALATGLVVMVEWLWMSDDGDGIGEAAGALEWRG